MPVHVKTPAVPVVYYRAPGEKNAQWYAERDGSHCRALCKAEDGYLVGIALTGKYVEEKMTT